MTCSQTAQRWETWTGDPRKALEREIIWECSRDRDEHGHRLQDELQAIDTLIANHAEEFATLLQRQAWLKMKTDRAH
jgi:hypothetical protein